MNPAQTTQPRQTLEQKRASFAWARIDQAQKQLGKDFEKYTKAAKGLPALIMNSGLLQTLAFCHEKGSKDNFRHMETLATHLRSWLSQRFSKVLPSSEFTAFMQSLMKATPQDFQAINAEAFAWLKWLRQLSAARLDTQGA